MKNKINKILITLLTVMSIIFLVACGGKEISKEQGVSLNNNIPKDGIVKASVFEELMESKNIAVFSGKNDEFTYEWMFMGSDIKNPEDTNLLVNPSDKNLDEVKKLSKSELVQGFKFEESKKLQSKTALSISLNKKWKCSSADIYKYNEKEKNITKVSGGTVETSKNIVVNFSIEDREGEFYIVASDPKEEAIQQDKKKENEDKDRNKKDDTTTKTQEEKAKDSLLLKEQLGIDTEQGEANKDGKDKYLTDPTPEGKPKPVEWNESGNTVDKSKIVGYCTLSIRCDTLLEPENRKVAISNGKGEMIPEDGAIYKTKKVKFYKNESVFDVLLREVQENKIHMEFSMTPIYNSNYIEGINNLYEFDGGELSGWMYKVNGWFPNYGCSRYKLKDGDVIEWVYTCDLGRDVGCDWMGGK